MSIIACLSQCSRIRDIPRVMKASKYFGKEKTAIFRHYLYTVSSRHCKAKHTLHILQSVFIFFLDGALACKKNAPKGFKSAARARLTGNSVLWTWFEDSSGLRWNTPCSSGIFGTIGFPRNPHAVLPSSYSRWRSTEDRNFPLFSDDILGFPSHKSKHFRAWQLLENVDAQALSARSQKSPTENVQRGELPSTLKLPLREYFASALLIQQFFPFWKYFPKMRCPATEGTVPSAKSCTFSRFPLLFHLKHCHWFLG